MIFEVEPAPGERDAYLVTIAALRPALEDIDGFLSIERFESLRSWASCCRCRTGATRRLSFNGGARWRHYIVRCRPSDEPGAFAGYCLRASQVVRDYGMSERAQAPADLRRHHDGRRGRQVDRRARRRYDGATALRRATRLKPVPPAPLNPTAQRAVCPALRVGELSAVDFQCCACHILALPALPVRQESFARARRSDPHEGSVCPAICARTACPAIAGDRR